MVEPRDLNELLQAGRSESPDELRRQRVRDRVLVTVGAVSAASMATTGAAALGNAAASGQQVMVVSGAAKATLTWLPGGLGAKLAIGAVVLGVASVSSVLWRHADVATQHVSSLSRRERAGVSATPSRAPQQHDSAVVRHEATSRPSIAPTRPPPVAVAHDLPVSNPVSAPHSDLVTREHNLSHKTFTKVESTHLERSNLTSPLDPVETAGSTTDVSDASPLPTLAAEAQLLSRALHALDAHDAARALELLGQHAARFPNGALAPERAAARIRALCAEGHTAQAFAERAQFERLFPGSPLVRAISDCRP